jgi:Ca2+-binding RTX toxin-like protein
VLLGGSGIEFIVGDSNGVTAAHGSGGNDLIDLGADGGFGAVGDHNTFEPGSTAAGAGSDRIRGGSASEQLLIGDSSADNVTEAGDDEIEGRGGDDLLFGDNIKTVELTTNGTIGGEDQLDGNAGNDTLRAGPANDSLDGDGGTDDCDGEAGSEDRASHCELLAGIP